MYHQIVIAIVKMIVQLFRILECLASFDPVALDKACADLVNHQTAFQNSLVGDNLKHCKDLGDHFDNAHPVTNWRVAISYGKEIGLG